jgi:hypothetical protein
MQEVKTFNKNFDAKKDNSGLDRPQILDFQDMVVQSWWQYCYLLRTLYRLHPFESSRSTRRARLNTTNTIRVLAQTGNATCCGMKIAP